MKAQDFTGWRRGRLVALERKARNSEGTVWSWRCDCGTVKDINLRNVRQGKTQSCGCLHDEVRTKATRTHGHTSGRQPSPTVRSYWSAKQRCYNPKTNNYKDYGGRGITMFDEWRESFEAFLADMGERPAGTTLDRINPDGNYEPANCRWATPQQQGRGRRNNLRIDASGRSLRAFARVHKLHYPTLLYHYRTSGKPIEDAIEATRNVSPLSRRRSARPAQSEPAGA